MLWTGKKCDETIYSRLHHERHCGPTTKPTSAEAKQPTTFHMLCLKSNSPQTITSLEMAVKDRKKFVETAVVQVQYLK